MLVRAYSINLKKYHYEQFKKTQDTLHVIVDLNIHIITDSDSCSSSSSAPPEPATETPDTQEELFHFIHPSVTDDAERLKIHLEIKNLVRTLPLPEICRYMQQMKKEKRVYLNVKIDSMYAELLRLGMPDDDIPGYSFKNFKNYFNVND